MVELKCSVTPETEEPGSDNTVRLEVRAGVLSPGAGARFQSQRAGKPRSEMSPPAACAEWRPRWGQWDCGGGGLQVWMPEVW